MIRRLVLSVGAILALLLLAAPRPGAAQTPGGQPQPPGRPVRPGDAGWPVAWATYRKVVSLEADFADLKAHGVGCISYHVRNAEEARAALELARRTGMKFHLDVPDVTERGDEVKRRGLEVVDALMLGGVYRGKAIDRYLFSFTAGKHEIVIEPPVYNKGLAYTRGSGGTGAPKDAERIGHYYPDMPAPVRAEVVVAHKHYDGRQHLRIVPAEIAPAPADTKLDGDSSAGLPAVSELTQRKLYCLSFDLSGLEGALLDQVGLAVYWPYRGTSQYWMFGKGCVTARAPSTRQALRQLVRERLAPWAEANGGKFPHDAVAALRFGDECFHLTGHLSGPAVSYPLWDYSDPAMAAFREKSGGLEPPRTWGYPEIYGPEAYGWWRYALHEACAELCQVVRDEVAKLAPGLLVFRNTTRMGVFAPANDHDGSGQDLLAQHLDAVHLDPYPVTAAAYSSAIPTDMSYCAGLARRHGKLLIPWMQAHTYGGPSGLTDVSAEQVDRMAEEQMRHGPDAILWLGYGYTFPKARPDAWARAGAFHQRLAARKPPKPQAKLAVLRPYRTWACAHVGEGGIRNPADWMLQQFLHVWAVQEGQAYDVFELPPRLSPAEAARRAEQVKRYPLVVSTEARAEAPGAWVIGADTLGQTVDPKTGKQVQERFARELRERGWVR